MGLHRLRLLSLAVLLCTVVGSARAQGVFLPSAPRPGPAVTLTLPPPSSPTPVGTPSSNTRPLPQGAQICKQVPATPIYCNNVGGVQCGLTPEGQKVECIQNPGLPCTQSKSCDSSSVCATLAGSGAPTFCYKTAPASCFSGGTGNDGSNPNPGGGGISPKPDGGGDSKCQAIGCDKTDPLSPNSGGGGKNPNNGGNGGGGTGGDAPKPGTGGGGTGGGAPRPGTGGGGTGGGAPRPGTGGTDGGTGGTGGTGSNPSFPSVDPSQSDPDLLRDMERLRQSGRKTGNADQLDCLTTAVAVAGSNGDEVDLESLAKQCDIPVPDEESLTVLSDQLATEPGSKQLEDKVIALIDTRKETVPASSTAEENGKLGNPGDAAEKFEQTAASGQLEPPLYFDQQLYNSCFRNKSYDSIPEPDTKSSTGGCKLPEPPNCDSTCCRRIRVFGRKLKLCFPPCYGICAAYSALLANVCPTVALPGELLYRANDKAQRATSKMGKIPRSWKVCASPWFGDVLNETSIYFDSDYLDVANLALKLGSYAFTFGIFKFEIGAQTFANRMYFPEPEYKADYKAPDELLATFLHEMVHVSQWAAAGRDLGAFARKYFEQWCRAGCSYDNNPYEVAAYDFTTAAQNLNFNAFACCVRTVESSNSKPGQSPQQSAQLG